MATKMIDEMPEMTGDIPSSYDAPQVGPINDPESFRVAISHAQMEGVDEIFVTQKLMTWLTKDPMCTHMTHGDPGVHVYVEGKDKEHKRRFKQSAEQYAEEIGRKLADEAKANGTI